MVLVCGTHRNNFRRETYVDEKFTQSVTWQYHQNIRNCKNFQFSTLKEYSPHTIAPTFDPRCWHFIEHIAKRNIHNPKGLFSACTKVLNESSWVGMWICDLAEFVRWAFVCLTWNFWGKSWKKAFFLWETSWWDMIESVVISRVVMLVMVPERTRVSPTMTICLSALLPDLMS